MPPDDDKTQTHIPLISGTMVSHYRIIEKIGAGGMVEVCLAKDGRLNRLAGAPVRSFSRVKRQIKYQLRYNGVRL